MSEYVYGPCVGAGRDWEHATEAEAGVISENGGSARRDLHYTHRYANCQDVMLYTYLLSYLLHGAESFLRS